MSKTIIVKEIDGHEIIVGFSKLARDPVGTRNVAAEKMKDDPLIAQKNELFVRKKELAKQFAVATKAYMQQRSSSNKAKVDELESQIKDLANELNNLAPQIIKRFKELCKENKQYFHPPQYERAVSDDEYSRLQAAADTLGPNHKLKSDGTPIHDFRGKKFYFKDSEGWNKGIIKKLDQKLPDGAKTEKELTPKEKAEIADMEDLERIYKMSNEARENEKKMKLNMLMLNTNARMELEAETDEQKQHIRDEYKTEKTKIEERYDV